ncbi:unnamed protein product [Callosobruchus maculatus]|uniref:Uncharacterized protein n=1 Tax=Callosobruchus maculatus TaxID=64391 RepID=A0A653DAW1_CALMS|nr:unnamed protein product [Callosobruchus maculatus]
MVAFYVSVHKSTSSNQYAIQRSCCLYIFEQKRFATSSLQRSLIFEFPSLQSSIMSHRLDMLLVFLLLMSATTCFAGDSGENDRSFTHPWDGPHCTEACFDWCAETIRIGPKDCPDGKICCVLV